MNNAELIAAIVLTENIENILVQLKIVTSEEQHPARQQTAELQARNESRTPISVH